MDSQKLLALTSLLFIIKVYSAHAQCTGRVEFINQPSASPTITARSYVQPVSQIVIPAIIQPLIQTEPCTRMPALPPSIPDYSNLYNSLYASSAMPPIIFDSGSQNDLENLLYFLLFAMRNRKNGGFGCGCGRGCCCGNSCGCGGNCNNSGGCSKCCGCSNSKGCGSCNCCGLCGNFGYCNDCGNGCNGCNGGCSGCNNGNGNCACGGNCMLIPYPIAMPIGNAFQCLSGGGYSMPVIEATLGGCDDCQSSSIQASNGQNQNEVTLLIRTE